MLRIITEESGNKFISVRDMAVGETGIIANSIIPANNGQLVYKIHEDILVSLTYPIAWKSASTVTFKVRLVDVKLIAEEKS
jgi:hypothetical protein